MKSISQSGGLDFVTIVLQYALEKGKSAFFDLIKTKISSQVGDKIMTLAEQLRAEGKAEAKIEIADRLIVEGAELCFVAEITGIPIEKLKERELLCDYSRERTTKIDPLFLKNSTSPTA